MADQLHVRATVAGTEGSTPREAGAAMLVSEHGIEGTIGGGALELQALQHAHRMLEVHRREERAWQRDVLDLPLGPSLGQCCGGRVQLLLEVIGPHETARLSTLAKGARLLARPLAPGAEPLAILRRGDLRLLPGAVAAVAGSMLDGERPTATALVGGRGGGPAWLIEPVGRSLPVLCLWGAGHVGRAIVRVAEGLPLRILWIDTSPDRFPGIVPAHAERVVASYPFGFALSAPGAAYHLVMTYSHQLDHSICEALLSRGDFAFLGLIGSETKRARFLRRLREAGHGEERLGRLVCPIGIDGITGKEPAAIAVAAVAQVLREIERTAAEPPRVLEAVS